MGLDSVELLVEVEKYFRISISDSEAGKLYTVQDMVDTVARYLNITSDSTELQDNIFSQVCDCVFEITKISYDLKLTDIAFNYLNPAKKEEWHAFEIALGLVVPKPDFIDFQSSKTSQKLKKFIGWKPAYDWLTITFGDLTNAICASNYQQLINIDNLKSKYEIYIGVMGITVDKIGVDYFEISPGKSFTSDLGVD